MRRSRFLSSSRGRALSVPSGVSYTAPPSVSNLFWSLNAYTSPRDDADGAINVTTTASCVSVPHDAALVFNDGWFVSLWFKPTSVSGVQEVVSKLNAGATAGWQCYLSGTSLKLNIAGGATLTHSAAFVAGQTYFLVIWQSADNSIHLSVNNGTAENDAGSALTDSGQEFTVGGYAGHLFGCIGEYDSVCIGAGTPSAGLRTSLYNSGRGKRWADLTPSEQSSFEGWWDLAGSSSLTDATGHGHNGAATGVLTNASSIVPAAYSTTLSGGDGISVLLDGSGNRYNATQGAAANRPTYLNSEYAFPVIRNFGNGWSTPDAGDDFMEILNPFPTGAKTFWMAYRCREISVNSREYPLFSMPHAGGLATEFWPQLSALSGYLGVGFGMDATSGSHIPSIDVPLDTIWHVVKFSWDGVDDAGLAVNYDNVTQTVNLTDSGPFVGNYQGGLLGLGLSSVFHPGAYCSPIDLFSIMACTGVASGATDRAVRDWMNGYVGAFSGAAS